MPDLSTYTLKSRVERWRRPVRVGRDILANMLRVFFDTGCKYLLSFGRQGATMLEETPTVVVIKVDAIGDFVVWSDSAMGLRELYPRDDFRLVLVANSLWVELAHTLGVFDSIIGVVPNRFFRDFRYRWQIHQEVIGVGASIAIQPTRSRELAYGDSLVRMTASTTRIGSAGDSANSPRLERLLSDRWYTRLVPLPEGASNAESIFNAHFVRELGLRTFKAGIPHLAFMARPKTYPGDYFALFPGASWHGRKWPPERFVEIARRVHRATGWTALICGGPEEAEYNKALTRSLDVPYVDCTGQTSLAELFGLIGAAKVLISNETGAVHIAAALGQHAVCILGGGHFGRFLPYELEKSADGPLPTPVYHEMECFGCDWRCIYRLRSDQPAPCVAAVSVEQVWETVEPFTVEAKLNVQ